MIKENNTDREETINSMIVKGIDNYGIENNIDADEFFAKKLEFKTKTNFLTYKDVKNNNKKFKLSHLEIFFTYLLKKDVYDILEFFAKEGFTIKEGENPLHVELTESELLLKVTELNGLIAGLVLRKEENWKEQIILLTKEIRGALVSFENKLKSRKVVVEDA